VAAMASVGPTKTKGTEASERQLQRDSSRQFVWYYEAVVGEAICCGLGVKIPLSLLFASVGCIPLVAYRIPRRQWKAPTHTAGI
jgi:hypothetical protein